MDKKPLRFIVLIIGIGILIAVVVYGYQNTVTHYNESGVLGNTAGNLYNGGMYCEYGDLIYYHNFNDEGALYQMNAADCSNSKKLYDDYVCYINADKNYIYYSRYNNKKADGSGSIFTFYNTGIFRINRKGNANILLLYNKPSGVMLLSGNYVYYQHYDTTDGLKFYKVGIDAKEETKLLDEAILPASILNSRLYYAGVSSDHYLRTMDIDTNVTSILSTESTYLPIASGDYIYYISLSDYSICRMSYDGQNIETVVSDACFTYNLTLDGKKLIYQVDRGDSNKIAILDLNTMESTTILDGDYNEINVTSNFIFFKSFDSLTHYAYSLSSGVLNTFHPAVESN